MSTIGLHMMRMINPGEADCKPYVIQNDVDWTAEELQMLDNAFKACDITLVRRNFNFLICNRRQDDYWAWKSTWESGSISAPTIEEFCIKVMNLYAK